MYEFTNAQVGIPSEAWEGRDISGAVVWEAGRDERGGMTPEGAVELAPHLWSGLLLWRLQRVKPTFLKTHGQS